MNKDIVVSVCMITYNHEKFIREAIDGVLMQKTNFPIELVIGEDCSTDNTREIVMEYAGKFPEIIKPLLPNKNLGMSQNFMQTLQACTGKYIALCEGDDYWTDPYKLQKQVDFLETNEEYSICSHRFSTYNMVDQKLSYDLKNDLFKQNADFIDFDINANFKHWFTQTLSVVIRKDCINFEYLQKISVLFDSTFFFSILRNGKGRCLNFKGAVYRVHSNGVFSGRTNLEYTQMYYYAWKSVYEIDLNPYAKDAYIYFLFSLIKVHLKQPGQLQFSVVKPLSMEYLNLIHYKKHPSFYFTILKQLIKRTLRK